MGNFVMITTKSKKMLIIKRLVNFMIKLIMNKP